MEDPVQKRVHLKTAIQQFATDAAAPPLLRDVLALSFKSAADRAQIIEGLQDFPELTRTFARLGTVQAGYRVSWEEAIYRLAPRVLRFYIVRWALRRTITPERVTGFDLDKYWEHVESCAHYAECLADRIQSPYRDAAGAAGLLHDMGKLALAAATAQGYGRMLQLSSGIFTLDSERAELGCDHTLAGKWIAERWAIPEPYLAVVWLHHHPTRHLEQAGRPVELIDIVALANILAHLELTEGEPDSQQLAALAEDRWLRLGLSREDVLELIAEDAVRGAAGREFPDRSEPAEAAQVSSTAARDAAPVWAVALEQVVQAVEFAAHADQILGALVSAMRTHFQVEDGLLCVRDGEGLWAGVRWDAAAPGRAQVDTGAEKPDPETMLQAVLAARSPGSDAGILALPIHEGGVRLGQLYVFAQGAAQQGFGQLPRFLEASTHLLANWRRQAVAAAQGEGLAETVWTQELQHHQQLRRAERAGMGKLSDGLAAVLQPALSNIMSRAQALLGRSRNPEEARALETILAANHRAMAVMSELLQFVQPSAPQLAPVALSALLEETLRPLRRRLEDQGIVLNLRIEGDLPPLFIDAAQIQVALVNVIHNAEAAMRKSGGELGIRVRSSGDSQAVRIYVHDTGEGIPAQLLDRVFEPFFSIYRDEGHAGLGLSICKSILEAHRGTIALHSGSDGTTCTITLPVRQGALQSPSSGSSTGTTASTMSTAPHPTIQPDPSDQSDPSDPLDRPAPPPRAAKKHTVLIVDEDEDLRALLSATLGSRGYHVRTAEEGMDALATALSSQVDLVLLDALAERVQGESLIALLRMRQPRLPIIYLAGPIGDDAVEEALRQGAATCLRKPFHMETLLKTMERLLNGESVAQAG
ncbi:MAG: HDOD domain-containing protein [Candidatus Hydrogenedentes bacterium]|nr:HDOD domain-containing protein [Candidatus Hydrogenedentota bacterium]